MLRTMSFFQFSMTEIALHIQIYIESGRNKKVGLIRHSYIIPNNVPLIIYITASTEEVEKRVGME